MKTPLFTLRKANEWLDIAAKTSENSSLYTSLWYEGEIVCLMDKARTGKTALALRIATKVAETRKVLFIDFASTLRRFAEDNHTRFADSLYRFDVDRAALRELGLDGTLECLEEAVRASGIKVCVIDSLTWICNLFRKPDTARLFMRRLAEMSCRLGLSVLVVAEPTRRIEPFIDNIFSAKSLTEDSGDEAVSKEKKSLKTDMPAKAPRQPITLITPEEARTQQPRRSLKERLSHPGVRL